MVDLSRLIDIIWRDQSLDLSPAIRRVIINRLEFEPTEAEITRARLQVLGRETAST